MKHKKKQDYTNFSNVEKMKKNDVPEEFPDGSFRANQNESRRKEQKKE